MLMRKTLLLTLAAAFVACAIMWPPRDSSAGAPQKEAAAASPAPAAQKRHWSRRPFFRRLFGRSFARGLMEDGYRAVSIPVNEYELGHIRIGDRVDVLTTFAAHTSHGPQTLTATMLQNVQVLGVRLSGDPGGKGALTLKVNPVEAQYAALGVRQADCSISLRHEGDDEIHPMEMSDFGKFFR